ncbi:MAG TPA: methionine ABC transporter permease, partial [Treponemataceae bacterium]|nr:methionine ABC transporter permease [Treponemataceae bacterium]
MSSIQIIVNLVGTAALQTLIMVFASTVFSLILGFPLGILLCTADPLTGISP